MSCDDSTVQILTTSGLYYNDITFVNDASSVVSE
jgi:hypothetical protein